MRLLCNGYVDRTAGSVASASFYVLDELLRKGHEVVFVSKRSFVYPAELLARYPTMRFVDSTNRLTDWLHECFGRRIPYVSVVTATINHASFIRSVLGRMTEQSRASEFDAALFLGLVPPRPVDGVPTVCWIQGPPGTDVRSLARHQTLLRRTEGWWRITLLRIYGRLRMTFGVAPLRQFAHVIVGSRWAVDKLCQSFGCDPSRTSALAYPVDLEAFPQRLKIDQVGSEDPLQVLWLGRIVPRKRLDLLLDAASRAEAQGIAVQLTVVGAFMFAPGLRKLLDAYPHPQRLTYRPSLPRDQVHGLLVSNGVLCQASDEENFGSSVAEAMACGTPVIVGRTNGTADYIDAHSVHLNSDDPAELAAVFAKLTERKRRGTLIHPAATRAVAEQNFDVRRIVDQLEVILKSAASAGR